MLQAHALKSPRGLRTLIWCVVPNVAVNPPFIVPAPVSFVENQSFPWAVSCARTQRVAGWLRKRSHLQDALRMRSPVTRMLSRRYRIFVTGLILRSRLCYYYYCYYHCCCYNEHLSLYCLFCLVIVAGVVVIRIIIWIIGACWRWVV